MKLLRLVMALSLILGGMGYGSAANAQCVTGSLTAELVTTGPYAGFYKYCLSFSWDTPQGLSNLTLDCGLDMCPGDACNSQWFFDDPAGTSTNVNESGVCTGTAFYAGEFNCGGNPSIGIDYPIIKWDALPGDCEPAAAGSGMVCFYSPAPPVPNSSCAVALVKNGLNVCSSHFSGACPAICTVPNETKTWGAVKADYK